VKETDRLFEAAFDGSELDVRNLKQGLSKSAAEELDSRVTLKADLKKLGDVPECQLTTDHLRRAVLNSRPLAPARRPLNIWAWTPLVAAASLGLFMFVKGGTSTGSGSIVPVVPNKVVSNPIAKTDNTTPLVDTGAQDPVFDAHDVVATTVGDSNVEPRRHRSAKSTSVDNSDGLVAAVNMVAQNASTLMAADFPAASSSVPEAGSAGAFDKAEKERVNSELQKEPVVIVSDRANPTTGAAEAQEVSRPSDVVFGG